MAGLCWQFRVRVRRAARQALLVLLYVLLLYSSSIYWRLFMWWFHVFMQLVTCNFIRTWFKRKENTPKTHPGLHFPADFLQNCGGAHTTNRLALERPRQDRFIGAIPRCLHRPCGRENHVGNSSDSVLLSCVLLPYPLVYTWYIYANARPTLCSCCSKKKCFMTRPVHQSSFSSFAQ